VLGVTEGIPVADERREEKGVLAATGPRSIVEYTPPGIVGLAVLNVLVETQNECPSAAIGPLVPLSVASDEVIGLAASVVTSPAANTGVLVANKPNIATSDKTPIDTVVKRLNNFFINLIIFILFFLRIIF
jgi:hypothetical protein